MEPECREKASESVGRVKDLRYRMLLSFGVVFHTKLICILCFFF
jgi:hypothetical protein